MAWDSRAHAFEWRKALVAVALTAPLVILPAMAGLSIWLLTGTAPDTDDPVAVVGPTATSTYTSAPATEVDEMHEALHPLGDVCARDAPIRAAEDVDGPLAVMLTTADRHPNGRVDIDDENGSASSHLLVLQEELRACDPSSRPRVEELLPEQYR